MQRRLFILSGLAWATQARCSEEQEKEQVQELSLAVDAEADWGGADEENIRAVCLSAARSIWRNCPGAKMPDMFLRLHPEHPLCAFEHDDQDRVVIFVTTRGNFWSQLLFQFAHEFCHALIGHTNDWKKKHLGPHPNHWLEESLCECASLFALRDAAKTWKEAPPYPNWKSYAENLQNYADERMNQKEHQLPEKAKLADWLKLNEPNMRENSTLRAQNTIVASRLLPIFEKERSLWACLPALGMVSPKKDATLLEHLRAWRKCLPEEQHGIFDALGEVFSVLI